ncbi:tumor necrosis factor ligand superfamily member 14 [Haplochromis burtoni]|uniref:Tumor necrosis factor ligand superfamily member 14-like n=1 Tax=Haplochromis burtoni TaxID=8153 RepID=A0A3Q2WWS3_HAPBU|nr:tumor necrosis factor ligand superfamily member 14 [Haplochromis burtoni]XP_014191972.1 tumor necrosis factor ligand superfamily member 14 [Haplochromis burtoni]XP_042080474.1 tumor necrosis factor ligand superfamily member 14 [Haplochromis burtoni]
MSEGGAGACPQVFVVDSQASYIKMPPERKPRWGSQLQKFLLLLVGLAMLGIIVEGFLIYKLYQRTEASSSNHEPDLKNRTNPKPESLVGGRKMSRDERRPFAHLLGSNKPGTNDIVQWAKEGDAVTQDMKYEKGRLTVEKEGYYYIYSKVIMNAAEECSLSQHKVMKETKAYDKPIELMQSKSIHCSTSKPHLKLLEASEDLWNSYLAGIFQLQVGDEIYVTLKNITKIHGGSTLNFMGAFMIYP